MTKKVIAEFIGTFVLVFIGPSTAVLGGGIGGIGILGIAMAFGVAIMAMCYSIGTISGCHINPAVSIAMFINRRMSFKELIAYIISQCLGAIAASGVLYLILKAGNMPLDNFGQDGFGHYAWWGAFLTEFVLTFIFVLVILVVTGKKGSPIVAGIVIGVALTAVHLVGIPITGTSVNPARSLGPALFAGGIAMKQLWLFIVAPIAGAILSSIVSMFILDSEK
ncbi:MIP family channel protein [uncultured Clostridium sp.]|jgi:aquaporin Z|uniref:MIP family channel protein n=1 Tax=uncultured Clostridium sp. TaxID=59620 RepID=UPI002602D000|nr:MIP family channel protein [uncultured Clostridium sp.]